jgi:transposase-like protein
MKQNELTVEQRKYYLAHGGVVCPICHGKNFTDVHQQTEDSGYIWQVWRCDDCDAEWTDEFTLTNVWLEEE